MVKISDRADSLAGYDMVVAISEEAINAQLEKLYSTPIDTGRLPPPSKVTNYKPMPPAGHLINHNFVTHLLNFKKTKEVGKEVYRDDGIDGFIECPKIRFRPSVEDPSADGTSKYKKAHIEITFKKDDQTGKSSKLLYNDPEDRPNLGHLTLDGYTICWSVKIARRDVEDVMNTIIKASRDPQQSVLAHDGLTKQLEKYVDTQAFTVSSIFCLFEEQTMVDSFMLLDPDRKRVTTTATTEAMKDITGYFSNLQNDIGSGSAKPVPENPYILGYSISQKIKSTSATNTSASLLNTPSYFKPKQFNTSVTPGKGLDQHWITTSGTLNFCLLTHREGPGGSDTTNIDDSDLNAGVFEDTFFDITKTVGRTKDPKGNVQGHDGIMGISKELFNNLWLQSVTKDLLVDPMVYQSMLGTGLDKPEGDINIKAGGDWKDEKLSDGWKMRRSWKMDTFEDGSTISEPYYKRQYVTGDCTVVVKYSSDTSSIADLQDGLTHKRRILFDIDVCNTVMYVYQTRSNLLYVLENADHTQRWFTEPRVRGFAREDMVPKSASNTDWLNGRTMEYEIRSLIRVVLTPGVVGTWNIEIDKSASKNLFEDGQALSWDAVPRGQVYGNFTNFELHHTFKNWGNEKRNSKFKQALTGWSTSTKDIFQRNLVKAFAGLGGTIIMPAGDVFMFAGMDSDEKGNVYAQVDYANEGGVEVLKKKTS